MPVDAKTFKELASSIRDMTARLRNEDKDKIRQSWETLGSVEHHALLLSLRQPALTKEECRGLIYAAMESMGEVDNAGYQEALLNKAEELVPQLSQPDFQAKIGTLAGQAKQFDKISAITGALLRGL